MSPVTTMERRNCLGWKIMVDDGLDELTILVPKSSAPKRVLETFPKPLRVVEVRFSSDEVTSLCPVTGQPDFSTVEIAYAPRARCVESKSLKLYLWSFREDTLFCESLSDQIAADVHAAAEPHWVRVTVVQHRRGGIITTALAEIGPAGTD